MLVFTTTACIDVDIKGDPASGSRRRVQVSKVLVALGARFGVRYDMMIKIGGTYIRPLPRVIARLLSGYSAM